MIGYLAEYSMAFDKVKNITIKSYPCQQFFGNKMPYKKSSGDYDSTKQYYNYNRLDGIFTPIESLSEHDYYRNDYYENETIKTTSPLSLAINSWIRFSFDYILHVRKIPYLNTCSWGFFSLLISSIFHMWEKNYFSN